MNSIDDIKIVGFDDARPPRVRKEAYIDLFFKLSHKAPTDWCEDFNSLGRQLNPSPKIDINRGECIDSYVNDMEQIAPHLEQVKKAIIDCNQRFMEKLRQKELALAASNADLRGQDGEQYRLNQIVDALDFNG